MSTLSDQIQSDLANVFADWDSMIANPRTSKSATVSGLYRRQYVETSNISGYQPTFACRSKDVTDSGLAVDDAAEVTSDRNRISKKKFKVVEIEDNGLLSLLILQLSA